MNEEQQGRAKAKYGKAVLKNLSQQLLVEFGTGFDDSNLRNMRKFYLSFPIRDALRPELSWTHYRIISRIKDNELRLQYIQGDEALRNVMTGDNSETNKRCNFGEVIGSIFLSYNLKDIYSDR